MAGTSPPLRMVGGRREQGVSGSLSLLPPLLLLEAAERNGQDCRLTLRDPSGGNVLVLLFRGGRPIMVFSPGDGRSLGELLLAAGRIDHRTLSGLVTSRAVQRGSLERLLRQRTRLEEKELQRFFDFQARARLLEALSWRAGSFEMEHYCGDEEADFRLHLPSFQTLAMRAQARQKALAQLLPTLPAPPEHLLVRQRTATVRPEDDVQSAVFHAVGEGCLFPQLVARVLCDDDLVLRAVMELVGARALAVLPKAVAVPSPFPPEEEPGLFRGELLHAIVRRLRGDEGRFDPALWVLVVGEDRGLAEELVNQLGGGPVGQATREKLPTTTVARVRVRVAGDATLCAVAVEPDSLSRAAIDPLLSRFDVLCVVAGGTETPRLDALLGEVPSMRGPLVVGVGRDGRARRWPTPVRAVLTLPDTGELRSRDLLGVLLEVLHGAASQT